MIHSAMLLHAFLSAANADGEPNCEGCFNQTSGVCVIDVRDDAGACPLATPADCKAKSLPFMNNSLDTWPTGCLAIIQADGRDCMGRLEDHACDDFTQHANTAAECATKSKALNATYMGFRLTHDPPGMTSINCQSIFRTFKAMCAGFMGAEYDTYTELATGKQKFPCNYKKPPVN